MRAYIATSVAVLFGLSVAASAKDKAQAPHPAWMAGAWIQQNGDKWADEYWTPPRAGIMLGAARMGKGDKISSFEHTRIARKADGSLVFIAQPGGAPPSEFPMIASGNQDITFANTAHDYPQKVRYWREGKLLRAEISLTDGTKKMQWSYSPMGTKDQTGGS